MFYVYLLKSKVVDFYYKGFCQDLDKRLAEHNSGMTKSNKAYRPFEVIYVETCETEKEAVLKEKYWKSSAGRRYLKQKI